MGDGFDLVDDAGRSFAAEAAGMSAGYTATLQMLKAELASAEAEAERIGREAREGFAERQRAAECRCIDGMLESCERWAVRSGHPEGIRKACAQLVRNCAGKGPRDVMALIQWQERARTDGRGNVETGKVENDN